MNQLIDRWRLGDEAAAAEVVARYCGRLLALARRHLRGPIARRVDPEDVVQSVCRSFFAASRDGRLVADAGDLWPLLAAITLNKVADKHRMHTAARRSVGREQPFSSEDSLIMLAARRLPLAASADEDAVVADVIDRLLAGFTPRQRHMIELRLQGFELVEIAEDAGCSRHTVMRVLSQARDRLTGLLAAGEPT